MFASSVLLATEPITVMQATPATWRMLRLAGWRGTEGLRIFCGGEALPRDLADQLLTSGAELWNLYGPTETTVWSTVERVGSGPITIGRPLAGERAYVVDPRGHEAPIGVPGELWLGGAGVALGYHDRPELTAERFGPNPFADCPFTDRPLRDRPFTNQSGTEAPVRNGEPGRIYRTGDIARVARGRALGVPRPSR